MTHIRPLSPAKSGIMTREEKKRSYPQSDRFNRHSWLDSMWGRDASNIEETVAASPVLYFEC